VKVCTINPQRALCEGCGRTLAEIAAWPRMSEMERRALMAALPARLERSQTDS
jgi:uncharacterized protein